jgi:hypothetical protein
MKEIANVAAARAVVAEGSIDEGIQQAPVLVEDDTRIKKIYVYTDNVFSPQSAGDSRTIRVKTDAFDLTGWIDFTHARPSDQFQVEIRVNLAHTSNVHFNTSAFQGGVLAPMQQLTPGMNYISGNFIDVIIRQMWSADNFATKVPVAYQFIVESR